MEQSRRRRKKNVYVEYDYEEAYQKQIENLEEDIIKRMMDGKKIKYVYATKEIKAGEQLEVEIYPEFTRKRVEEIPEEGRRKKDRQAQRNLNEKNSRKQCERVINENFGDRDIWATFTYSAEYTPASMKVAKSHMQNYIRRLNYQRKKRGLPNARYVYVTEQGDKGRWHHHIVLDGDMDMDTVESLWTYGKRNQVRRLQKDENGLVGMAKYVSKPKGKGKDSEEGKYQKIWTPSKNLKKPDEHKNHYKTKQSHVDKMSAVVAALIAYTDASNDDVPSLSPSNEMLGVTGTCLADGTEVTLDQDQGSTVNTYGVATAINMNGWKLWGNYTGAFPSSGDAKDIWLAVRRMFNWHGNNFIQTYFEKVDDPMNHVLIESIIDSENIRCAAYAPDKWAGAEMQYLASDNPITDTLAGKITFRQRIAPYTPAQEIDNILSYDTDMLKNALSGGGE